MKLIFASNNTYKLEEIRAVTGPSFLIISLKDAGIEADIPEPYHTIEENAIAKSTYIHNLTGEDCFSEDSGLIVDALNGEPGVKSARYADGETEFSDNNDKLLKKLGEESNRKAYFKTVISLIINGQNKLFEGICPGKITTALIGNNGFGYDPLFIPDGSSKTFAEMAINEKNEFSHRTKAVQKLVLYLKHLKNTK